MSLSDDMIIYENRGGRELNPVTSAVRGLCITHFLPVKAVDTTAFYRLSTDPLTAHYPPVIVTPAVLFNPG